MDSATLERDPRAFVTRRVSEGIAVTCRLAHASAYDGRESRTGPGLRILRGGGFADSVESLDPTLRHPERPHRRLRWNGLRLARSIPPIGPN